MYVLYVSAARLTPSRFVVGAESLDAGGTKGSWCQALVLHEAPSRARLGDRRHQAFSLLSKALEFTRVGECEDPDWQFVEDKVA